MDEPQPSTTVENPPPPASSLTARLLNVYVAPTEVFDEIKPAPPVTVNWLTPLVLLIIAGIISVLVIFSQPGIIQNMRNASEKKMQENVAAGKMTQAQADQSNAMVEKIMSPTFFRAMGILGAVIVSPIVLLFNALIVWLLGNFAFHGSFSFSKAVETTGLVMMISVLGVIVNVLLKVIFANPGITLSPALLVSHFDPTNKVHLTLAALDVTGLWFLAVLSLGLARLSGARFWKAALWLFGISYGLWAMFALGLPALIEKLRH